MNDIEIKTVKATEIAIPRTKTLYWVAYWYNGSLMSTSPWEDKSMAERHAAQCQQNNGKCVAIYKFDIEVPDFSKNGL